jgi:hypothetical protein
MKAQQAHLPVFPIPIFLLPEGITRLSIFEPRYLKLISIASQGQGFIIYCNDKTENNQLNASPTIWGSWVEIINFGQDKNGLLEIDVICKSLVKLKSLAKSKDGLFYAKATKLKHWSTEKVDLSSIVLNNLSETLTKVIESHPVLHDLYPIIDKANAAWIIARWLELLPIEKVIKPIFIKHYSFDQAKEFVQNIIHN